MVKAETRITLDTPEVVCKTNKLTTATLRGTTRRQPCAETSNTPTVRFKSNGVQVDDHGHGGVCKEGGSWTEGNENDDQIYRHESRDRAHTSPTPVISRVQSCGDILRTPVGSRVMRRDYGLTVVLPVDMPQTDALRLQIMCVCYMALLKWEPRISISSLTVERQFAGRDDC